MAYSLIIAGSTNHTRLIADCFLADPRFEITVVITPAPKLVGRKQILTKNPLHLLAESSRIPVVLVEKKLDQTSSEAVTHILGKEVDGADFLLVVDFGYYVPSWLLKQAKIQPLNVHPSALPAWRGSSPGQFLLLTGETQSAVSLITVATAMDQGDVWLQPNLAVDSHWDASDYYQAAFSLISPLLPESLISIAAGIQTAVPQSLDSPTTMARRLDKHDSFFPWSVLRAVQTNSDKWIDQAKKDLAEQLLPTVIDTTLTKNETQFPLLIEQLNKQTPGQWPGQLERASRAFSPWPRLWTLAPTPKGNRRVIILQVQIKRGKIELPQLQLEGKNPATWAQLKTSFKLE